MANEVKLISIGEAFRKNPLLNELFEYGLDDIYIFDPDFANEIFKLVVGATNSKELKKNTRVFSAQLFRRLTDLQDDRRDAIDGYYLEVVEGEKGDIFRIKFNVEGNLRILFAFRHHNKADDVLLIHAFQEKSKFDYRPARNKARNRLDGYDAANAKMK